MFPYSPGKNTVYPRGYATEEEAAKAAIGTTYASFYKAASFEKVRRTDPERWRDYQEKKFLIPIADTIVLCPAYRTWEPYLNKAQTKVIHFRTCGATACIFGELLFCYSCGFQKYIERPDSIIASLKYVGLVSQGEHLEGA